MMKFKKRTTAPTNITKWFKDKNPFYNTKYSMFKLHPKSLGNCTHYAYGRASEILNKKSNLPTCNAINWFNKTNLKRGTYPKLGAIICYKGSKSGHVGVVEEIKENGDLIISMSGWNSYLFKTKTVLKKDNYCYSNYNLLGFIYLPIKFNYSYELPKLPERSYFKNGDRGVEVKKLQRFLNWANNSKLDVDGIIGVKTINEVKKFQKNVKIKEDGLFGNNSMIKAISFEN